MHPRSSLPPLLLPFSFSFCPDFSLPPFDLFWYSHWSFDQVLLPHLIQKRFFHSLRPRPLPPPLLIPQRHRFQFPCLKMAPQDPQARRAYTSIHRIFIFNMVIHSSTPDFSSSLIGSDNGAGIFLSAQVSASWRHRLRYSSPPLSIQGQTMSTKFKYLILGRLMDHSY